MVVLEAAAIGAAGYGVYKGGEVGIRKTKELQKEYQRESHRSIQRGELKEKCKARQSRIANIMSMRRGGNGDTAGGRPTTTSIDSTANDAVPDTNPSWLVSSTEHPGSSNSTSGTSHITRMNNNNNIASSSSVEDRHQAVMAKLRSSRRDQAKKDQADSGSIWNKNPFSKRK